MPLIALFRAGAGPEIENFYFMSRIAYRNAAPTNKTEAQRARDEKNPEVNAWRFIDDDVLGSSRFGL